VSFFSSAYWNVFSVKLSIFLLDNVLLLLLIIVFITVTYLQAFFAMLSGDMGHPRFLS